MLLSSNFEISISFIFLALLRCNNTPSCIMDNFVQMEQYCVSHTAKYTLLFKRKKKIEPLLQCITIIMCWFLAVSIFILFPLCVSFFLLLSVYVHEYGVCMSFELYWWCQIEQFLFSFLLLCSFSLSLLYYRFCFLSPVLILCKLPFCILISSMFVWCFLIRK